MRTQHTNTGDYNTNQHNTKEDLKRNLGAAHLGGTTNKQYCQASSTHTQPAAPCPPSPCPSLTLYTGPRYSYSSDEVEGRRNTQVKIIRNTTLERQSRDDAQIVVAGNCIEFKRKNMIVKERVMD